LEGRKFWRQQHSIGYYIIDFYCAFEKLAVELDGQHHFTEEGQAHDKERTRYLSTLNIRVVRFKNEEVFQSPEGGGNKEAFHHPCSGWRLSGPLLSKEGSLVP
jgi:very-short-patch-repair endonuclease